MLIEKHQAETQQCKDTGEPDDQHRATGMIGKPAPDIGSNQLRRRQDGDQATDSDAVISQGLQVQAPVRNQNTERSKVEKVKAA